MADPEVPVYLRPRQPQPTKVTKLPSRGGPTPVQTPLQSPQYVQTKAEWEAGQIPDVIRGDARVYSGEVTDYLGKYGRVSQPFFENAQKTELQGWMLISQNPAAMNTLADIYRAHYRKPANYIPSQNQLMSLYQRAVGDASTAVANDARVTVSDVLNSYAGMDVYGIPTGGGGPGAGSGPSQFETRRNEADVRLLANSLAQEMIGRNIDEDEFSRMMRRVRQAESDAPRVVSSKGARQITEEGISDAERQEVLREVLMENPEFETFQGGEGLIDNLDAGASALQSEMAGL